MGSQPASPALLFAAEVERNRLECITLSRIVPRLRTNLRAGICDQRSPHFSDTRNEIQPPWHENALAATCLYLDADNWPEAVITKEALPY